MNTLAHQKVYVQRDWTDQELVADGFLYYHPVKRITMARMLPPEEAPKTMKAAGHTVTAEAGYWIAYTAGKVLKDILDDYKPRPIEPEIFVETYKPVNNPNWHPTPTQSHLQRLGCQPYYKTAGVWAKQLTVETQVQSMESTEPSLAAKGTWLCIGVEGEPWTITEDWFQAHYRLPGDENPTRD